jgi:Tol biopolymer transport system component
VLLTVAGLLAAAPPNAWALGAGGVKAAFDTGGSSMSGDAHFVAFSTASRNITPEVPDGCLCTYLRDTQTGVTNVESKDPNGVVTAGGGPISANGQFLLFGGGPIYERDLQTHVTTLVSRASGASGAAANGTSGSPDVSADGRFVAFSTAATNLSPDDISSDADVYVRDLQTNVTTLVSRATGTPGAKADQPSYGPSISADGRFVAFVTSSTNLDPSAIPPYSHVYVRDLQTNTTRLADRASGASGASGNRDVHSLSISGDGASVAFATQSTNLSPDDPDTNEDVYVRNLQTNTTTLADRASGPSGAKADNASVYPLISGDGRLVAFSSLGANLDPGDSDGELDIYLRDLNTSQTTLVSRATGAAGVKGNSTAIGTDMSPDGRYVMFESIADNLHPEDRDRTRDVFVRDLTGATTYLESRATAGYARYVAPRGATPFRASLVPAFAACGAPNSSHGAPLAFPSCSPPTAASPNLTIGVGDRDPAPARSIGSLLYRVTSQYDPDLETTSYDVGIGISVTNVMRRVGLSDYTGELQARTSIRMTDRLTNDGYTLNGEGTVTDFDFALTVPCIATSSTIDGGSCALNTTAKAVLPGFVKEGLRRIYGLGPVRIYDGGPDEDADTTGDNSLFEVQGVFAP